jgi:hypothetical protein
MASPGQRLHELIELRALESRHLLAADRERKYGESGE